MLPRKAARRWRKSDQWRLKALRPARTPVVESKLRCALKLYIYLPVSHSTQLIWDLWGLGLRTRSLTPPRDFNVHPGVHVTHCFEYSEGGLEIAYQQNTRLKQPLAREELPVITARNFLIWPWQINGSFLFSPGLTSFTIQKEECFLNSERNAGQGLCLCGL